MKLEITLQDKINYNHKIKYNFDYENTDNFGDIVKNVKRFLLEKRIVLAKIFRDGSKEYIENLADLENAFDNKEVDIITLHYFENWSINPQ